MLGQDNKQEEALNCAATRLRASFFVRVEHCYFLPNGIIAYADKECNILQTRNITKKFYKILQTFTAPDFLSNFFDQSQFCPLLFFGELIADFTGCEAVLRAGTRR